MVVMRHLRNILLNHCANIFDFPPFPDIFVLFIEYVAAIIGDITIKNPLIVICLYIVRKILFDRMLILNT